MQLHDTDHSAASFHCADCLLTLKAKQFGHFSLAETGGFASLDHAFDQFGLPTVIDGFSHSASSSHKDHNDPLYKNLL